MFDKIGVWLLNKGKFNPTRWVITVGVLGFALVSVFYTGHLEGLIRTGVLGIAILALFFSSKPLVRWTVSISVLSLSLFVVFYLLGEGSLYDWDEAIYAQVAKEIAISDDWLTLTWAGDPFWQKPPLYFWLTALVYKITGINEFAARFWSATFGFGVIALTFWFGLRLFSWAAGVLAALLLLSIDQSTYCHWYNFLCQARVGMLETMLTFWLVLSLILVWEAKERPRLIILLGITAGLAVMTKAWIGLFALAMPLLYALITGQFYRRRKYWSLAILLAAAIILPWHLWQIWIYGYLFLHDYFVVNVFGRMTGVVEAHQHSQLFYFGVLGDAFPIFGLGYLWPTAYLWVVWTARTREYRQKVLLLMWIAIPLLLFSLAQTTLGWYIILIYPGIALLIAQATVELLGGSRVIAALAVVTALFYFRLPAIVDGSPDVKQFAKGVTQIVSSREVIYVNDQHKPENSGNLTEHNYRGAQNLRPSLTYYLDYPLACIHIDNQHALARTTEAYVIVDSQSPDLPRYLDGVLLRDDHYVLARSKGVSFHRC